MQELKNKPWVFQLINSIDGLRSNPVMRTPYNFMLDLEKAKQQAETNNMPELFREDDMVLVLVEIPSNENEADENWRVDLFANISRKPLMKISTFVDLVKSLTKE